MRLLFSSVGRILNDAIRVTLFLPKKQVTFECIGENLVLATFLSILREIVGFAKDWKHFSQGPLNTSVLRRGLSRALVPLRIHLSESDLTAHTAVLRWVRPRVLEEMTDKLKRNLYVLIDT